MYKNYVEIREVWANRDSNCWLPLENFEELGRNGKLCSGYNALTLCPNLQKRSSMFVWHSSNTLPVMIHRQAFDIITWQIHHWEDTSYPPHGDALSVNYSKFFVNIHVHVPWKKYESLNIHVDKCCFIVFPINL